MSFLLGANFLDKCMDFVNKVFCTNLRIAQIMLGSFLGIFLILLFFSKAFGDYNKNLKALKMIATGEVESGLIRLKGFAPTFDKTRFSSPSASEFDFDRIVMHPHSYSLTKRLPIITMGLSLFFASLAALASSLLHSGNQAENKHSFTILIIVATILLGLILFVVSSLLSLKSLKKGCKRFNAMIDFVKDINATSLEFVEKVAIEESAEKLFMQIEHYALLGGADYVTLNDLHLQICELMQRANSQNVVDRLTAALDIVEMLIDSASKN